MIYSIITEKDLDTWIELLRKLLPEEDREDLAKYCREQLLVSSNQFQGFKCSTQDGKMIAFLDVNLRHDYVEGSDTSPIGYIEEVYVEPDYRHQGIARTLMEMAEQWAKERGCTEMASDTQLSNVDSQQFHKKVGFQETEKIVHFIKKIG